MASIKIEYISFGLNISFPKNKSRPSDEYNLKLAKTLTPGTIKRFGDELKYRPRPRRRPLAASTAPRARAAPAVVPESSRGEALFKSLPGILRTRSRKLGARVERPARLIARRTPA
ncbi:hypothetical protein EVAR_3365_1 [Eumeta japonica]|uniref:Uncharacterized protein n=1 Tax=Eumeta variegata TaxID=151549 RepID=A0A4C1SUW3_EUMVA|nr:hypothetical protein EVAR_3365_1 [Eumeta japonica]